MNGYCRSGERLSLFEISCSVSYIYHFITTMQM
nr:MAG TPA: hypothetical protein [Caudoviricetes sp.]